MRRPLWAAAIVIGLIVTGTPAQASSGAVAIWEMNESSTASTMRDSSTNSHAGSIGTDVRTGITREGSVSYRFPTVAPNALPVRPGHTVVVPDASALDPRSRTFSVELRLRAAGRDGNVLQKGQATTKGGFWKIELNDGEATCLFRGPDGTTSAVRARGKDLTGSWHTVRCVRSRDAVELWVDGVRTTRNTRWTGHIANTHPLSIGGKQNCNQVKVGCDYYSGNIDYVRISST